MIIDYDKYWFERKAKQNNRNLCFHLKELIIFNHRKECVECGLKYEFEVTLHWLLNVLSKYKDTVYPAVDYFIGKGNEVYVRRSVLDLISQGIVLC